LNTLFAQPVFAFGDLDGWSLIVAPRIFTYIGGLSDNPDLKDYRGYGQLRLVLGKNSGPSLMYTGIAGQHWDHVTTQLDLTIPVRTHLFDFETFLLVQYFNGYGESLLSYRERTSTVRAGFSLVR
jgi:outer membrane phospholipase A